MFVSFRTYIAVPSSAWIDDYFEWSVEGKYCCRLHENGSFCRRNPEGITEDAEEEVEAGGEGVAPRGPDVEDHPLDYVGGADFEDVLNDDYLYEYTYGDLDVAYDHVEKKKEKKPKAPKYEEDIYDYSYSYGDLSVNYDDGQPLTGTREIPGDDGWPNNSKDPSETHPAHKKHHKAVQRKRSVSSSCHVCNISSLPNNPFRPNPEVFNQYLPMFLKDNPDIHCPKAGHAAYGQASGEWFIWYLSCILGLQFPSGLDH